MSQKNLEALVAELQARIVTLEAAVKTKRDRGPKSTREMTDGDAYRIMFGDLKDAKHKTAAEVLDLSYAQIYSARNGFTFKHIAKAGPKVEEPKVEEPKVEEPKVEEPKVEEPKVEEPKVEKSKA